MPGIEGVGAEQLERFLRWTKYILGIVGTVGGWAMALTIWLVMMRGDVTQLRVDYTAQALFLRDFRESVINLNTPLSARVINLEKRVEVMDSNGTRGLETVRNRQLDVLASNNAQDARIRVLENAQVELLAKTLENKYQIDQLFRFMHPPEKLPPRSDNESNLHQNTLLFQMPP